MKTFLFLIAAVFGAVSPSLGAETNSAPTQGSYQIRNYKFGELLRPKNADNADGTRIVLYPAAPWKCMTWKLRPTGSSTFQLQNHFTGKTFEAKTNGAQMAVVQVPFGPESSKNPVWNIIKLANGFYRIADVKTGQALTGEKAGVSLAPWEEKQEQEWELIETDPTTLTM